MGALFAAIFGGAAPAQAAIYNCPTSFVCTYQGYGLGGQWDNSNGYNSYTNLTYVTKDKAMSWANACNNQHFIIGDWRNGTAYNGQHLPPGWYEEDLRTVNFAKVADYVGWL